MLRWVLQLLQVIYRRFQQDSQTAIRENKEGMHRQLGMGRERTTRIQRIKDKTHDSTSTGLLRPPRSNQDRNRRHKICLLRYTIATIPGREIETSGIPIQDNVRCRMHLRHTPQGTTGNRSGFPRMETIHGRKSINSTGPDRS